MNAEQKQRAVESLAAWRATAYALHADRMADLLQELVDAPEPEPFGYFKPEPFGWTDCAETDDGAIALYELPPAPSVPDNVARDAARLDWLDERNAPHGLGWEIIQMPAGNVHIHTLTGDKAKFGSIRDAIDAAMSEKGGKA